MTQLYMPLPTTNVVVEDKGTEIMNSMLLEQYQRSDNLKEYFGAFVGEMDLLFAETERVYLGRMLEYATGDSLDTIGIILDQPRGIASPTQFFGFVGAPSVEKMSDEANPQDGGIFRSEGQSLTGNYVFSDDEYRRVLTAKAMISTRDGCTANNIYYIVSTLLGRTPRIMRLLTSAVSGSGVADRQVLLEISTIDVSNSDKSLIEYFSQYLFPLGTGFTVTRI